MEIAVALQPSAPAPGPSSASRHLSRTGTLPEVEIIFLHLPRSEAVEAAIRRRIEHLTQYCDDLHACRVVIDLAQRHTHQGRPFEVRVDLTLNGRELVANRSRHEDVYVALRDAFDVLTRQLEHAVERRRAGPRHRETVRRGEGLPAQEPSAGGTVAGHGPPAGGTDAQTSR